MNEVNPDSGISAKRHTRTSPLCSDGREEARSTLQPMKHEQAAQVMMKKLLFIALVCFAQTALADDVKNHDFLYGFLSGTYLLVGQESDSGKTYSGRVIFKKQGDHLEVTRIIHGQRITGVGTIEHALGPDKANVLRVRFNQNKKKFEITYLWRSDLDNYARLSGYVYQPEKRTAAPGLEALFIDHSTK